MQTFQSFTMSVAILASWILAQNAIAQIFLFESESQSLHSGSSRIVPSGSFGVERHPLLNSTITAEIHFHDADRTATFRRVEIDIEDLELSSDFVVESGVRITNTISGTIDFDSIVFTDVQAFSLVATEEDRVFSIDGFERSLGSTNQPDLTGSYEFSGPTESVEGTFSFDPSWERFANRFVNPRINTTDYPSRVAIIGSPSWEAADDLNLLVNEMIDGVAISVGMDAIWLDAPDDWEFQNAGIVPEPSTYAFAMGWLLIGFIAFRRMQFVRNA